MSITGYITTLSPFLSFMVTYLYSRGQRAKRTRWRVHLATAAMVKTPLPAAGFLTPVSSNQMDALANPSDLSYS